MLNHLLTSAPNDQLTDQAERDREFKGELHFKQAYTYSSALKVSKSFSDEKFLNFKRTSSKTNIWSEGNYSNQNGWN